MKKVLFVVPQLSHGGSNKSLENILSKLDSSILEIKIYSLGTNEHNLPYYEVFFSHLITQGMLYRIAVGVKLIRKILNAIQNYLKIDVWHYIYHIEANRIQKKENFDVVIGFEESYATVFASRFTCEKKIAWMHCDYNLYKIYSGGRDEHALYRRFNHIVAVSEFAKRVFVDNFPEAKDKTSVIYNILDCDRIKEHAKEEIQDERFKTDNFTIVSIGRITEVKQFDLIPDFARQIKSINLNSYFRWYIIGDGDEYIKEQIERKIKEYGLEDTVILLGAKSNPYPYIKQAHLHVCTSRTESWSYVINEAKVLHTPVVTLRCGSSEEVVVDGKTGLITTKENISSVVSELIQRSSLYCKIEEEVCSFEYDNSKIVSELNRLIS